MLRVGYIVDLYPKYRDIFTKDYERRIFYDDISNIEIKDSNRYEVLTIGDSFTFGQGCIGYNNYINDCDDSIKLLNFNILKLKNPIQILYSLANGDFLKKSTIKYVILESVERDLPERVYDIDTNSVISIDDLSKEIECENRYLKDSITKSQGSNSFNFPLDRIIKFPLYNILRY